MYKCRHYSVTVAGTFNTECAYKVITDTRKLKKTIKTRRLSGENLLHLLICFFQLITWPWYSQTKNKQPDTKTQASKPNKIKQT